MKSWISTVILAGAVALVFPARTLEAHERPFLDDLHPHPPFNTAGAVKLNADELKSLADTTWYMVKGNWISYFDPTGTMVKTKNTITGYTETGALEITDTGLLCLTWKTFKEGQMTCFNVWKKRDVYHSADEVLHIFEHFGTRHGRMTIKRGNGENL